MPLPAGEGRPFPCDRLLPSAHLLDFVALIRSFRNHSSGLNLRREDTGNVIPCQIRAYTPGSNPAAALGPIPVEFSKNELRSPTSNHKKDFCWKRLSARRRPT